MPLFLPLALLLVIPQPDCAHAVGGAIGRELGERWPAWSIVRLEDLDADDRVVFRAVYPAVSCPGVTKGHFFPRSAEAVAVLLQRGMGSERTEMVMVYRPNDHGSGQWFVASEPALSTRASIVRRMDSGRYTDVVTGRAHSIETDAIGYEQLEAGLLLLFWREGSFRSAALSQ